MKEMNVEERKIKKVNAFLGSLDKKLDSLVLQIEMEKDKASAKTGNNDAIETNALSDYIDTINAIKIDGKEDVLIAINSRYDNAINVLKRAVQEGTEYKEQFKAEYERLIDNKAERFDPIAETYKELSDRLDKGEAQRDYYQDKADRKEAAIKVKDKEYKDKCGNLDTIIATLEEPYAKIKEKLEIQQKYVELIDINKKIEELELALKEDGISEEQKEKIGKKIERLKEKRKVLVEDFEKTATNKDGMKYTRPKGKSDKDYINGLDAMELVEAVEDATNKFADIQKSIDPIDSKIVELDKEMKEIKELDINKEPVVDNAAKATDLMELLNKQKKLWNLKMKEQGYNKQKLQKEQRDYQKMADSYMENEEGTYENKTNYLAENTDTSFGARMAYNMNSHGKIVSFFKSLFGKKATEKAMREETVKTYGKSDKYETKEYALKYLEKNRGDLNKINALDKKKNRNNFKEKLSANVAITENEINKFWDNKEVKNRESKDNGREPEDD